MLLEVGICLAGAGRSQPVIPPLLGPPIMTPENEKSLHYFYGFPKFAGETSTDAVGVAFKQEDQPMIEAVQRNTGDADFGVQRPAILKTDSGAIVSALRRHDTLLITKPTVGTLTWVRDSSASLIERGEFHGSDREHCGGRPLRRQWRARARTDGARDGNVANDAAIRDRAILLH